jgi:hypothetical protein
MSKHCLFVPSLHVSDVVAGENVSVTDVRWQRRVYTTVDTLTNVAVKLPPKAGNVQRAPETINGTIGKPL